MNSTLVIELLVIGIAIALFVLVLLFGKARKLNNKIKAIEDVRHSDIAETNKLFVEKSENELQLFFQFENVLEELVKLMRKADSQQIKLIEKQDDIRILLEHLIKK